MSVEIRETPIGGKLSPFLDVVDYIYRDDPCYVRPLDLGLSQRLSKKNPFFEHAEAMVFTAHRNGWCVGRCTAQVDREYLTRYRNSAGSFGFFDTIDDVDVAEALLDRAGRWLSDRGMRSMHGPLSLSTKEEIGCLVDGFDTPPMMSMPHHRPYQGELIETAGLARLNDLYASCYEVGEVPQGARKVHDEIAAMPEVSTRQADPKRVDCDLRIVVDICNDARSDDWGFVPLTESERVKMARDLKLLLVPDLTYITSVDGEPAAVALCLPNINELIGDLHGKLLPFGAAKLLYRLKLKKPTTARLAIVGIRKKYRHVRKYAGLSTYLYAKMNDSGLRQRIKWGELSWTIEENAPVNAGIKFMGGKIYKRYRIYEKKL